MMGSLLTRALVMVLGYAYPAYECYKTVELNKPEIEQLRFWCQYWILVALLTIFERVGDTFISWLPMYCEAKLAFYVYLWYPKTRGTTYVYDTFFRPYISKHEKEIDRNLLELRTRAGDMVVLYWQKAAIYGQTRFFEILQYVASQSQSQPSRPCPTQQQPVHLPAAVAATRQPAAAAGAATAPAHQTAASASRQSSASLQPVEQSTRTPPSPTKIHQSQESARKTTPTPAVSSSQPQASSGHSTSDATSNAVQTTDEMEADSVKVLTREESNTSEQETTVEETIRITRARLRKKATNGTQPPSR